MEGETTTSETDVTETFFNLWLIKTSTYNTDESVLRKKKLNPVGIVVVTIAIIEAVATFLILV